MSPPEDMSDSEVRDRCNSNSYGARSSAPRRGRVFGGVGSADHGRRARRSAMAGLGRLVSLAALYQNTTRTPTCIWRAGVVVVRMRPKVGTGASVGATPAKAMRPG